jgi:hypothetical protein
MTVSGRLQTKAEATSMKLDLITAAQFASGRVLREPPGAGEGYWAGAPGIYHDARDRAWYLTYRLRRPRGVEPDRGGEARIARSRDLITFEDVWSVRKEAYGTASIERSCLVRGEDGAWHYFTSYVDPADGRWCVARLAANDLSRLDPRQASRVFSAPSLGLEGIKDPWLFRVEGRYHMFLSVAVATAGTGPQSHETQDIYNTGECLSATALAVSTDLIHWDWAGPVFIPEGSGWDSYCRRINAVWATSEGYLGLYDGSRGHHENYEEKTGLASSPDLRSWKTLNPEGPRWMSEHGSGSLRYLDLVVHQDKTHVVYELARADGAHELRLITVP